MEPRRTLGFLPNGMRAVTATGEERFVVENRMPWFREVELAKSGGPRGELSQSETGSSQRRLKQRPITRIRPPKSSAHTIPMTSVFDACLVSV